MASDAHSTTFGWGILATGKIAGKFAADLALVPGARLAAVGSRRPEAAEAFAATHGADRSHGTYQDLVDDPEVDIVYIASPHALHLEHARMAIDAGKHVLCEKPLTMDLAETTALVEHARAHDRFLMEAMWTACHPAIHHLRSQLQAGRFGTPHQLHAELGFVVDAPDEDRLLDPTLGASALLDMGIYPLTFAHLLFGEAQEIRAVAARSARGIDLDIAMIGRYPGDVLATMSASMTSWSSRRAEIATDEGRLVLDDFHHPTRVEFRPDAGEPVPVVAPDPVIGRGYGNEVVEVERCLRAGLIESPMVPHAQTLTLMAQLDDVRRQAGVVHPAG